MMNSFEDKIFSPRIRWAWWAVGGTVLAFFIFHAGVSVGSHRHPHPQERPYGFFLGSGPVLPPGFIRGGHGTVGEIATVTLPTFIVKEPDGDQETVHVGSTTIIRGDSGATTSNALIRGQRVTVLGTPNESIEQIDATFIRIISLP